VPAAESTTANEMMPMKGRPMMPKLSEASQKMMREAMEKVHEDNKPIFDDMVAKHKELQEIVKAPTFDKAAYLEKHEELDALRQKLDKSRSEAMASVIEKMPASDRAEMGTMGMKHGPHRGMMGEPGEGGHRRMMDPAAKK